MTSQLPRNDRGSRLLHRGVSNCVASYTYACILGRMSVVAKQIARHATQRIAAIRAELRELAKDRRPVARQMERSLKQDLFAQESKLAEAL